jgi:hypothetical protein
MRYFRILYGPQVGDRWFPSAPKTPSGASIDPRAFTSCQSYGGPTPTFATARAGPVFPFTLGPFDMLVLSSGLAEKMAAVSRDSVQMVSAESPHGQVSILNALSCLSVIDERRTIGEKWVENDGRPDKTGSYRTIRELYIDPEKVADGVAVFRLSGWRSPLIVSERVVNILGDQDLNGLVLAPVV